MMAYMTNSSTNIPASSQPTASPPTHHHHLPHPSVPGLHSHKGHHHGQRLREFLRPDGRKVHIAATPEDHQRLRSQLSASEKDEEFDLFIHGSPEHLEAIRQLHAHHQSLRDSLRQQHAHVYDEFEQVKADLDTLATELHMITEHGVSLDANFSKFGYSAHLRTKDDDSEKSSVSGDHAFDHESSVRDENDRSTDPLKFWKRPVVRQYFHKGLIWRSGKSGEVASFELFADLLYVGLIGIIGDAASENATGIGFLHFVIEFIITWKIWLDLTVLVNWFEVDDVVQRLCVLVYLICLLGFTTNLVYAFETTYASMMSFYIAEHFFQGFYFLWVAYLVPTIRGAMIMQSATIFLVSIFWIGSIHVEWPSQLALIFLALFFDLFGSFIVTIFFRWLHSADVAEDQEWRCKIRDKLTTMFDFFPAINLEHRVERTNAFVTLIFGASVLAIIYQNHDPSKAMSAFFGKSCLALLQAAALNWMYFDIDSVKCHVHAIRRHALSALIWISAHIPFIMGYTIAAASMSKLVLAHDCSNADPDSLGEEYRLASEELVPSALRWYYCAGLATSLISMAVISASHIHKTVSNARLKKYPRLLIRCCMALIICLLPLSRSLSSLSLMTISCLLVIFALAVDIYGMSCIGEGFFRGGFCDAEKKRTGYHATCPLSRRQRRRVERKLERGEKVTIDELIASQTKGKGDEEGSISTKDTLEVSGQALATGNSSEEEEVKKKRPRAFHLQSFV